MAAISATRAILVVLETDGSRFVCEICPAEVRMPIPEPEYQEFGIGTFIAPQMRIEAKGPLTNGMELHAGHAAFDLALRILSNKQTLASEAEQLALAVLRGDHAAALMLADLVQEQHAASFSPGNQKTP